MQNSYIDSFGTKYWENEDGQYHRLDGPAVEYKNGANLWYQNGNLHRLDGPAMKQSNGTKSWYQNGKLHRLDGPAIEYVNGNNFWFIEDIEYTEEEFNKKVLEIKNINDEKGKFHIFLDGIELENVNIIEIKR